MFDHSDFCHCLDWNSNICPQGCFRARITKELNEMDPPYEWPVSYASFKNSEYCPMKKTFEDMIESAEKEGATL